jgi:hypothetical protein
VATVTTIFERLAKNRPAPVDEKTKQPDHAQKLLDWLMQHWPQNTISRRDISNHGPWSIRNKQSAIDAAETLERHGWLVPAPTHRHDRRVWQIVRKNVVRPTVAE